jgi:hypothetical protein
LLMLEVSDADQNYDVYRTSTGGYSASAKPKTRAALAGLNLTTAAVTSHRTNPGRAWLDDAAATVSSSTNNSSGPFLTKDAYEDDDDEDIVDYMAMERRALASRESDDRENKTNVCSIDQGGKNGKSKKNNWSSRYTIDNTLLAMTGGTVSKSSVSDMRVHNDPYSSSNARILDRMDRESRGKNTQLLTGADNSGFIKGAIFGSAAAFNYRQNNVFGKQNVVLPSSRQPNLQAAFIDKMDGSTNDGGNGDDEGGHNLPPVNTRTRSWQDQVQQKRIRRRVMLLVLMLSIIGSVTFASIFVLQKRAENNAVAADAAAAVQSVTFYAISDTPIYQNDASKLYHELKSISDQTKFIIHLGNVQKASVTGCTAERYSGIASTLKQSSTKPMFIVPGTEDYISCHNQTEAFQQWYDSFIFFEQNWDTKDPATGKTTHRDIEPYHQSGHYENFAFVIDGVLFVGINEVGGTITDHDSYKIRNQNNYQWITGMINTHYNDIRATVIMGNYRPGVPQNYELFGPLGDYLQTDGRKDKQALYVHAYSDPRYTSRIPGTANSDNEKIPLYQPLFNVPNLMSVSANDGITKSPLRINIGFGSNPFIIG